MQKRRSPVLLESAQTALLAHSWPGNIRELDNVMQRALILSPSDEIAGDHLFLPVQAAKIADLVIVGEQASEPVAVNNIKLMEKNLILDALKAAGGVRKVAAEALGMSERTLRYKLAQYREEEGGLPI